MAARHADNKAMSSWQNDATSSVPEGEPGSGTTPDQPNVAGVQEGATPPVEPDTSPVTPEEPTTVADSAPDLPKPEQAEIAQNDADSPSVKDESAKLAGEAKRADDEARAAEPNKPVIREADPRIGGEHFL